jgi:hypothetical protein
MLKLTPRGQEIVRDLAQRYDVSAGAVMTLLEALDRGNGRAAQFRHPELGGSGQWMAGGMIQIGDMFNHALKARVDNLCRELSALPADDLLVAAPSWWPPELAAPSAAGGQNNIRYAVFPDARRLAVEIDGSVTVYDTLDHNISGISQQQGGGSSLTFTSQKGVVGLAELPVVSR